MLFLLQTILVLADYDFHYAGKTAQKIRYSILVTMSPTLLNHFDLLKALLYDNLKFGLEECVYFVCVDLSKWSRSNHL